jgi:hypothetical protein
MLLMGKSTISMAIFNSKLLVYQRVNHLKSFIFSSSSPDLAPGCDHLGSPGRALARRRGAGDALDGALLGAERAHILREWLVKILYIP